MAAGFGKAFFPLFLYLGSTGRLDLRGVPPCGREDAYGEGSKGGANRLPCLFLAWCCHYLFGGVFQWGAGWHCGQV